MKLNNFPDPSSIHITCSGISELGHNDGGGAQTLRQLSTIAFTKAFGFSYIHTPLSSVAHNYDNDPSWTEKWENFFQLSAFSDTEIDENSNFQSFKNSIELIPNLIKDNQAETDQFYRVHDCHSFINRNIHCYEKIRPKLKENYFSKRNPNLLFDENILNVAIHVRRGDIQENSYTGRFTSAEKLKRVIQQIETVIGSNKYKISIFCAEKQNDLEKLESKHIQNIYHLDIFDVLNHLIGADLLVNSKSTVSYIPAIINKGVIIYEPYWHQPLKDWLDMEKDFLKDLKLKLTKLYPKKFDPYSSGL